MVAGVGLVEGPSTGEGRLLVALLNKDLDAAAEIADSMEEDAPNRLFDAALSIVAQRYFAPDAPVREIARFADKAALVALEEGATVNKRVAEAVIRVALGERDLLNGVEPADVADAVIAQGCRSDADR